MLAARHRRVEEFKHRRVVGDEVGLQAVGVEPDPGPGGVSGHVVAFSLVFVEELPKTTTGKILRRELRG